MSDKLCLKIKYNKNKVFQTKTTFDRIVLKCYDSICEIIKNDISIILAGKNAKLKNRQAILLGNRSIRYRGHNVHADPLWHLLSVAAVDGYEHCLLYRLLFEFPLQLPDVIVFYV